MPNEMETVAGATKVTHSVQFSQVATLDKAPSIADAVGDPSGICWGLAFVWMGYKAQKSHEKFFEDVANWPDKATLLKAAGIYGVVQATTDIRKYERAAKTCGLEVAHSDKEKKTGHKWKSNLNMADVEDVKILVEWLKAARGERYFLMESSGHAMAATGSKHGALMFFDPNFGVVTTNGESNLQNFFHQFFKSPRFKEPYFGGKMLMLNVSKYTKGKFHADMG